MRRIMLLKIWYGIVIILLIALLYEHTVKFDLTSIVFWLRLVFLIIALMLTFYVIGDVFMPVRAARRIEGIFARQLRKKSNEIRRLKREKEMFARSAMKQANKNIEMKKG